MFYFAYVLEVNKKWFPLEYVFNIEYTTFYLEDVILLFENQFLKNKFYISA